MHGGRIPSLEAHFSVCHFISCASLPHQQQQPRLLRWGQQSARLAAHLLQLPPCRRHCRSTAAQGPVTSSVQLRQMQQSAQ